MSVDPNDLPLAGLRITDTSIMWAGPYLTNILATLGAEVIKIEGTKRLDPWRPTGGFDQSVDRWWERSPFFNAVNCNKLSLTLDLTQPDGVSIFKELVAQSDIVVENFTARVMPKLGLSYDILSGIRPDLIMISLPAYGSSGPWRDFPGFAKNIEQMSGIPQITGLPDGPPLMSAWEGFTDPAAGVNGVVAVLIALLYRQATGQGQYIDLSQVEAMTCMMGDVIAEYGLNDTIAPRRGNRHPGMVPHGYFRCRDDRWVAISVAGDAEWRDLTSVMGDPEWARSPQFATAVERFRHQDELEARIEQWTLQENNHDLAARLQSAGVAAGPILESDEFVTDPHLIARGTFQEVNHPVAGRFQIPLPTAAMRLEHTPLGIRRAAPTLGQHNHDVLRNLLGRSESEIERLAALGVIGTSPVNP